MCACYIIIIFLIKQFWKSILFFYIIIRFLSFYDYSVILGKIAFIWSTKQ